MRAVRVGVRGEGCKGGRSEGEGCEGKIGAVLT